MGREKFFVINDATINDLYGQTKFERLCDFFEEKKRTKIIL